MAGKYFEGTVKNTKMEKTLVIDVQRKFREPRTGKTVFSNKKYMVHCEDSSISTGDFVQFRETKPYSKRKKWKYTKVLNKTLQPVETQTDMDVAIKVKPAVEKEPSKAGE